MKKRQNKLNPQLFADAKESLEKSFPYQGVKMGFYVRDDFKVASAFPEGMRNVAKGAMVEMQGDEAVLQIYRDSDEAHLVHDVDEQRGVNKNSVNQPAKHEIKNHHIAHSMEDDMMERNQMTVEFVSDDSGGLKPNVRPDGMVTAYINFLDPMEGLRKKMFLQQPKNNVYDAKEN